MLNEKADAAVGLTSANTLGGGVTPAPALLTMALRAERESLLFGAGARAGAGAGAEAGAGAGAGAGGVAAALGVDGAPNENAPLAACPNEMTGLLATVDEGLDRSFAASLL